MLGPVSPRETKGLARKYWSNSEFLTKTSVVLCCKYCLRVGGYVRCKHKSILQASKTLDKHDHGWGRRWVTSGQWVRTHPPEKFLDPSKRASGLLTLGLLYRKKQSNDTQGGGKRTGLSGTKITSQNRSDHGGRKQARNHSAAEIAGFFASPTASKSLAASDFWG